MTIRISLTLFEMLQPGVNHFFDATQLGAPRILGVIEPFINGIEPRVHMRPQIAKARVINQDSHQHRKCGNANGKGDLKSLIVHRFLQNTPSGTRAIS